MSTPTAHDAAYEALQRECAVLRAEAMARQLADAQANRCTYPPPPGHRNKEVRQRAQRAVQHPTPDATRPATPTQ